VLSQSSQFVDEDLGRGELPIHLVRLLRLRGDGIALWTLNQASVLVLLLWQYPSMKSTNRQKESQTKDAVEDL
jgi:hypothetical protein